MQRVIIESIAGTVFPSGRHTRVVVGENAPLRAEHFQLGRVTIFAGGKVPEHHHANEEVYLALEGEGEITVGGETQPFPAGCCVYIPPNVPHMLCNNSEDDLTFLFVYAPATTVSHWAEELEGKIR